MHGAALALLSRTAAPLSTTLSTKEDLEAFRILSSMAHGRSGTLAPDVVARQALHVTPGADFGVRQAALEALLRRISAARRDGLHVQMPRTAQPAVYLVGKGSSGTRYRTVLRSIHPPAGSCECPDYVRSSLGLCKHLIAVLERVSRSRRRSAWAKATTRAAAHLEWDPLRPLAGRGDWLERVRFHPDERAKAGSLYELLGRRWFTSARAPSQLKRTFSDEPAQRLQLVEELLRCMLRRTNGESSPSDPSLLPLLRAEVARLESWRAAEWVHRELPRRLKGLKHKLYPYQVEGVRSFLQARTLLLADDMGLGKTAQSIAACHVLFSAGKVSRGLIVTPASLKAQWLREWRSFSDAPAAVVDGAPPERAALYRRTRRGFIIANYEQVIRDLPLLHAFRPEVVVFDEAQRIKNWATKTAVAVKQLKAPYRLVLSGTPMENRLDELASLMDCVDDMALEPKWRLGPVHATRADGAQEVIGARGLDTLRERLSGRLLRRIRKEVLSQLPPRTDTRVPVALTSEQQIEHDELNQPIASLVGRARQRPLTQAEFLKLMSLLTTQRIICNGLAQLRFKEVWPTLSDDEPSDAVLRSLFSPKLIELREILTNLALTQERKVVVFSQWRRMLKLASWSVSDVFAKAGVRVAFFTGEESQRRRTENLVDFHDDPAVRVLFATDAGGVGLNLQRASSCCVNLEVPWNPAVLEQRVGRIYRLGQSHPVEVYHLVSDGGIESRIAALVDDKKALFSGLFDGTSDEVSFDRGGSFFSRIERVFEPSESAPVTDGETEDEEAVAETAPDLSDTIDAEARAAVAGTGTSSVPVEPPPVPSADQIRDLFASLVIRPGNDGKVTFEAQAESAASLAAIFRGLALAFTPSTTP